MIITLQTLVYFRESLIRALDRLLRPYYSALSLTFGRKGNENEDEEPDEEVFAEFDFDDEKGVVFFPPVYLQRYAAVSDCLMDERWCGQLEKVVELGYHDMSFINYLKEVPGVKCILGVDIESVPLRCTSDLIGCNDFAGNKAEPLQVTLFEGNAADPDYRLIGCDAVVAIEMIEHMLPHDLERLVHTVFGFIRPRVAIFTTPNGDFNVLFKNLEKNGLRRWDHFFEWTREQYNDWCSNIVKRYPDYTVSCKGIGPGPPGTLHLGCCSQMAVFTAKNYHKQQDLNLNSLALVAKTQPNIDDLISSWDTSDLPLENNMICPANSVESYSDLFSQSSSCDTIVLSPEYSNGPIEYQDKMSQCNLDSEIGRNYLMFDYEQMCYDTVVPRRTIDNRVYVIEDVASRLNCTTSLVDKFSKTTQNLMAKSKLDTIAHTRDVVDEIRHITKMLNFNKESIQQSGDNKTTWCNINWGENAPYWNQFYKIVKEYKYPFETKSEECHMLELLSDEINRRIDGQCDEDYAVDVNKFEIPLEHLMKVVSHITDDIERVKDLLEWNGYEVVDNVLIHSRLVVDSVSVDTDDDWPDESSDWDSTDFRSTSVSDGSGIVPDYHARCLRRALERKVRKLRMMLTLDQDVNTEIDKVITRLMKLALRSSRGRQHPPPTRWMQCKLLDLLNLTEKAIYRRKKRFIENYPLKAIGYETQEISPQMTALQKIKEDDTAAKIFTKYRHLVQSTDNADTEDYLAKYMSCNVDVEDLSDINEGDFKDVTDESRQLTDVELKDDISVSTNQFVKDYIDKYSSNVPQPITDIFNTKEADESKLERTQAWLEEDLEVVNYPNHDILENSDEPINSASNITKYYNNTIKKYKDTSRINFLDIKCAICKKSHSKFLKQSKEFKFRTSNTRLIKKDSKRNNSYNNLLRSNKNNYGSGFRSYRINKAKKEFKYLQPTASKPIPSSLIELCHPELMLVSSAEEYTNYNVAIQKKNLIYDVAATENSQTIEIVSDGAKETIALKRNIGTDAECDPIVETETLIRSVSNTIYTDMDSSEKVNITTENQAQTIFLYDINEPTTSKGIRHCSMDVQCGPDVSVTPFAMSANTSLTRLPNFSPGIKIEDSTIDTQTLNKDCCTSTDETECENVISSKEKSIGIVIKDSVPDVHQKMECSTQEGANETIEEKEVEVSKETQLIKSASSNLKNVDSVSVFFDSTGSSQSVYPKSEKREVGVVGKFSKYQRPRLCCGGVEVHSYRNKQTSEDIMFQGEWQRLRPKMQTKKKIIPPVFKKINDVKKTSSKKSLKKKDSSHSAKLSKRPVIKDHKIEKPSLQVRNVQIIKTNQRSGTEKTKQPSKSKVKLNPVNVSKIPSKPMTCYKINKFNKNAKSAFVVKKPSLVSNITVAKEDSTLHKVPLNHYLPFYLKNKVQSDEKKKVKRVPNKKNALEPDQKPNHSVHITTSKSDIKTELLKFQAKVPEKYFVLRNEVDNNPSDEQIFKNIDESIRKKEAITKRTLSPQSQNSSTCSSPNSVATVRAVVKPKNGNVRRYSSSYKSNIVTSDSEGSSPVKNSQKKYTKRCKTAKVTEDKAIENKENIPQSSKQFNSNTKVNDKISKTHFAGSNKVYIAQLKESQILQSSKSKPQKSNINMPTTESLVKKRSSSSPASLKCSKTSNTHLKSKNETNNNSNKVVVLQKFHSEACSPRNNMASNVVVNHRLITDWIDNFNENASRKNIIASDMKQLIEETLDFIDDPYDASRFIDSDTIILSNDKDSEETSLASYKTVFTHDENSNNLIQSDLIEALNNSFDASLGGESFTSIEDPNLTVTDLDVLSFKSINSISKSSDCLTNENIMQKSETHSLVPALDDKPMCDIFERKEPHFLNEKTGSLTSEILSGLSINEVIPDRINSIDSETGSLAIGRQIISEELVLSGRSSRSFESCIIDDDTVVPNWLFQIISQQQSAIDDLQPPVQLMVPITLPIDDGILDANGNIIEGVGVGAGAGDGRGIHSDNSQDSSGRGTSSSSASESSSGVQSEAIIIDPSQFAAQFEMLREPNEPAVLINSSSDNEIRPRPAHQMGSRSFSHGESSRNPRLSINTTSDFDADVSSIDTDENSWENLQ